MEIKKGYKQTEVGVIPEDWDISYLSNLTLIIGDGLHGTPKYSPNGSYPFINGNNLKNGCITITSDTKFVIYSEFIKYKKHLNNRTILLSINGTIGNLALVNNYNILLGKSTAYLNIKKNISKKFIYYSLHSQSVKRQFFYGLSGSTIGNLGLATIRETKIALPKTKKEQQAIATALSDIDKLLEGLDRLIAKKRNIKQATMQQLLTGKTRLLGFEGEWKEHNLGNIANIIMGQSPDSINYNLKGIGLPLIQGNADIKKRKTIKRVFTTQITKRSKTGDTLMSVRAPVGEVSKATFDVCLGRGVCAIQFPNNYLYYYLILLEPYWAKHSKGSTFDSVNASDIKKIKINFPIDKKEQIAIANILSDMDNEIEALEQRRNKTRDLKQAMMQELLTGKIRLI